MQNPQQDHADGASQEPGSGSSTPEAETGEDGADAQVETSRPAGTRRPNGLAERARHAYLFHMWAEPQRGKEPLWRFSLEEVETGVRHGFGNWDALATFLHQRMAAE